MLRLVSVKALGRSILSDMASQPTFDLYVQSGMERARVNGLVKVKQ